MGLGNPLSDAWLCRWQKPDEETAATEPQPDAKKQKQQQKDVGNVAEAQDKVAARAVLL